MLLNKNMAVFGIVVYISILQSSCTPSNMKSVQTPAEANPTIAQPPPCGDPLAHYGGLAARTSKKPSTADASGFPIEQVPEVCHKLQEAILLSMPGNDQQNDKAALVLLQDLARTDMPSDRDQQFNNMLLQHVSQRQELREQIDAQQKRLLEAEKNNTVLRNQLNTLQSQIDQLKNIEVEMDKKERSLTKPNSD